MGKASYCSVFKKQETHQKMRYPNVTVSRNVGSGTVPSKILSAVAVPVYINLHSECELPCLNDFREKQGVLKLMVGALRPHTIYQIILLFKYCWPCLY